ncbi:MAG: HdeD family acid-resistance protein [Solirubrobacteraceae bacterium]
MTDLRATRPNVRRLAAALCFAPARPIGRGDNDRRGARRMAQHWTERLQTADAPASMAVWFADVHLPEQDMRTARRWLLATGILGILSGTAAIIVPIFATITTTLLIGWILVFAGAVMAWHAVTQHAPTRNWSRVAQAVLTLLIGLYVVIFPLNGALTLTLLLVIWFVGTGGLEIYGAYRLRGLPGAGWLLFNGVVAIVLAVLIAAHLPSSAAWAIGLLVGINLVFWGMRALVAASILKRALPRRWTSRSPAATARSAGD